MLHTCMSSVTSACVFIFTALQGNGTDASCSLSSRKPVLSEEFELSSPKVAESSQLHETVPQKMLMYLESSTPGGQARLQAVPCY